MQKAVDHIKKTGLKPKRIAAEFGFLPYDASIVLRNAFPDAEWVDALFVLERQRAEKISRRAGKTEIRLRSRARLDAGRRSPQPSRASPKPRWWKHLRREETNRGLTFEYCLITAGTSINRAPSEQKWEKGDIMSIDSGGNYNGYIGDICRMAIHGEPDAELVDLLGEIEGIQRAAIKAIKPGTMGKEIYAAAKVPLDKSKHHNHIDFLAHGMGLVSHERAAPHQSRPGALSLPTMPSCRSKPATVVSVETTLMHPTRGFIKLEDTVVVTDTGHEIYGEGARGWNRAGIRACIQRRLVVRSASAARVASALEIFTG